MNAHDPVPPDPVEAALAAEPFDDDDQALVEALAEACAEIDPVPAGLVERLRFALTLDALQAEVATLIHLDLAASGARGPSTESVRTVTFTSEHLTTMVTLTTQPGGKIRVDGWTAPNTRVALERLPEGGQTQTTADEDGRFVFEDLPTGFARFALQARRDGEPCTVLTPTLEL